MFLYIFLFGYLAKKKECDYIHALPLRRETLFFTKILGGFLQFVVPFGIFYAFFPGDRGWGFQMLVTFCGWLFLFGVTAFVMMLSGRKLAAVILVSLLLDLPACVYEVIESLYVPMLPGVYLGKGPEGLSPISYMMNLNFEEGTAGEILVPMGICALVGVAFLGAALVAYRKRRLERAGDFLAVRWLEPVLAWGLGIYGALITSSIAYMLEAPIWIPLVLGLDLPVMAEWSYPLLKKAPCRYTGATKTDDLVVMAHNYARHFGTIDTLSAGDEVIFTDMEGVITRFTVTALDVLDASAVEEMTAGEYDLTLFTCTYGGQSRVTVRCDQDA